MLLASNLDLRCNCGCDQQLQNHYQGLLGKLFSPCTGALKIVVEYDNLESIIAGVEAGRGAAVLYQSLGRIACKRAVLRPLKPVPQRSPIVIA